MASSTDTVQYIVDQIGLGRRLWSRKMFGEFALYLDEKIVALVCDDQLFLKPTDQTNAFLGKVTLASPYPGAKEYFLMVDELENPDRLKEAVLLTGKFLPDPKPRATRVAARLKPGSARVKGPAKVSGKRLKSKKQKFMNPEKPAR
jgi:TfoX/Sxy family transcriptional regulator of competence genes